MNFSEKTIQFIEKASRQKRPEWLDKNRQEYETVLQGPLQHLACYLRDELTPFASGYHFPQKGIGRIKRSANRIAENGSVFKNWISYSASRPAKSRFDHNPNLFFMIYPEDEDGEQVLVAGGLYMPSSRQLRAVREAIARDASPFTKLFATKAFSECFKGGFSDERISSRVPRGFDKDHPRMDWLRLQAFFVWKPYKKKEFYSKKFPEQMARDWRQILKLNELLDQAILGQFSRTASKSKEKKPDLLSHLENIESFDKVVRQHDF